MTTKVVNGLKYGAKVPWPAKSWAVDNYYPDQEFIKIKDYFYNHPRLENKSITYYGAKMISSFRDDFLKKILHDNLNKVKEFYGVDNIIPSYGIFSDYGDLGDVTEHSDEGPCFYTIDLCLYENTPWPLFVEESDGVWKEYMPKENQAIFMNASLQPHKRPAVNNPDNRNGILLLHYAPPEHQFFGLPENLQRQFIPADEDQYQFTLIREYDDIQKAVKNKNELNNKK